MQTDHDDTAGPTAPAGPTLTDAQRAQFDRLDAEARADAAVSDPLSADAGPCAANATPALPTADVLEPAVAALCQVGAPAWGIQPDEIKVLSQGLADVVDHYWPDGIGGMLGPWTGLIIAAGAVAVPRLQAGLPLRHPPKRADLDEGGEAAPAPKGDAGRDPAGATAADQLADLPAETADA